MTDARLYGYAECYACKTQPLWADPLCDVHRREKQEIQRHVRYWNWRARIEERA